ncbi:Uncharacterised protein [Vibrio cholerae]|nr:Uncharacterised protein [Vibrio cholerae]CSI60289.1 Uncharacterised protein [Vibrio cholerae]CSI64443.1 Uncharacterised protein [Vibrio cholerae]
MNIQWVNPNGWSNHYRQHRRVNARTAVLPNRGTE